MAAHPRSRGENWQWIAGIATEVGSSPLTRGKPGRQLAGLTRQRLIPAHAGKTFGSDLRSSVAGAHPRSRGENIQTCVQVAADMGSSPLTRGKRSQPRGIAERDGLIPAHAGKTGRAGDSRRCQTAHPRSRGENLQRDVEAPLRQGSSPLTRGKPPHGRLQRRGGRLIPAHAGKTIAAHSRAPGAQAHPRSRGENPRTAASAGYCVGSSPLTRGKPRSAVQDHESDGLIPAHAGKTTLPKSSRTP